MDWLVCFLVVLLPLQGESQPDDDLRIRVTAYWNSLQQGDKAAALNWVLPESRNAFIKRQEGEIRGWRLVSIEWSGHDEARVKVEVESFPASRATIGDR